MAAVINSLIIILFIYLFIYLELGLLTVPGTWSVESDSISYVCSAVANKGKKKKRNNLYTSLERENYPLISINTICQIHIYLWLVYVPCIMLADADHL